MNYDKLSKRQALELALLVATERGDEPAAAKFDSEIQTLLKHAHQTDSRNSRPNLAKVLVLVAIVLIVVLTLIAFEADIHADDYQPGTTGTGDRALSSLAMDRNYNCERADSGSCLPDLAVQMGPDANIPTLPSAGEGGASTSNREIDRPDMAGEYLSDDQVLSMIGAVLFVLLIFVGGMLIGVSIGKHPRGRR